MCPQRKRATVVALHTLSAVLSGLDLGIGLNTIHVNFPSPAVNLLSSLPACQGHQLSYCVEGAGVGGAL